MFPLLASWIEFAGKPMEVKFDGCITTGAYRGYEADNYR
jgi:hypothetical protein